MKKTIAFALVVLMILPALAFAQHTIAVSADPDGAVGPLPLTQVFDTPAGTVFDLVVWMNTDGEETNAAEFVMTELRVVAPGVLSTGTVKYNNALDLGTNSLGEYILAFRTCVPPGTAMEMVRVSYLQFTPGVIGVDQVVSLRGFQPGDTQPSTFAGEPGFVDCNENKFVLELGGVFGGITGADVVFADGELILNATGPVPVEGSSMGRMKARF